MWLDQPFTTRDTIEYHDKAFQFYKGITDEIVYYQDNLIAVSKNAGDLILTNEFQQYVKDRKFSAANQIRVQRQNRECCKTPKI